MYQVGHFINGKETIGNSDRKGKIFNPSTGQVIAKVSFANEKEILETVQFAKNSQVEWSKVSIQKRTRIIRKFIDLVHENMEKICILLSREHGKTLEDSKGDIQRGLEVAEFCLGSPHLLKGEFSENVSKNIDMFSIIQPLGIAVGITPFNFPAMIPM